VPITVPGIRRHQQIFSPFLGARQDIMEQKGELKMGRKKFKRATTQHCDYDTD
jgi:hypothetical protein